MNESKHTKPCRHQVTRCGLVSTHTSPRHDVVQGLRVSAYGSISPCLLRTSLRPGVTDCDWIQGSRCLDTLSQMLDPTRETHVFVCHSDSHSYSPVFVTLPGLSFKDKLSAFSTVPQNNKSSQTPHPERAQGSLFSHLLLHLEVLYLKWKVLLWSWAGVGSVEHGQNLHSLHSHHIPTFPTSTTPCTL